MCGVSKEDRGHRIESLLELVDMARWADMKIQKYSKGMLQRIGLAQALINDPDILLLDEPTDGVDPVGKMDIRKVLERVRAEGKSILLNSHLLSEVESVADRVIILNRGKVIREGAVKDLTTRGSQYQIEAEFGNRLIEIPEDIGRKLSLSTNLMIIELDKPENINHIIDLLRMKKISIRAVQPLRVSLEQSFIETISAPTEEIEA
jgi:ABC-2 type transport system ATP-binding protein